MVDKKKTTTFSIVELEKELQKEINKNRANTKLINHINKEFIFKKIGLNIPTLLFQNQAEVSGLSKLNNDSRICLAICMFSFLKDKPKLNPKLYFSNTELGLYENRVVIEGEPPTDVVFNSVIKVTNKTYLATITAEMASKIRLYMQCAYFTNIQRPTTIFNNGKNEPTEKITANKKGIRELRDRLLKQDIFPTTIAFAILREEGKKLGIKFIQQDDNSNMGRLIITPNFNREYIEYTPFAINDGYHRFTALADANDEHFIKTGKNLDNNLTCLINIMTTEEAVQYTVDSFKRNDVKPNELEIMTPSSEGNFVNNIIKNSEILKDNVVSIFSKIKQSNKFTSKDILIEAVKYTGFNYKDSINGELETEKIGKIIDTIINKLCKEYFSNDMDKLKETYLLDPNTFIGYLAIADALKNDAKYLSKLVKVVEELYLRIDDVDIINLKLKNKETDTERVFNYFYNKIGVGEDE